MERLYNGMMAAACALIAYTGFATHTIWLGVIGIMGAIIGVLMLLFEEPKQ